MFVCQLEMLNQTKTNLEHQIEEMIHEGELKELIQDGRVITTIIPDIESINYGRGVGYEVIEHFPPDEIKEISNFYTRTNEKRRKTIMVSKRRHTKNNNLENNRYIRYDDSFMDYYSNWKWGVAIGGVELITKMVLYYFHERNLYKFSSYGIDKTKRKK